MCRFTLIELLVVVLIIGILSAIALPQYEKAVEKSQASQALTLLKSVAQAAEAYYLENGTYATKFEELSISIPWTGKVKGYTGTWANDTLANTNWSIQIYNAGQGGIPQNCIYLTRISGNYKGAMWTYCYIHTNSSRKNTLNCTERVSDGIVFQKSAGSYCQKLFGYN